jgi:cell division protein FtsB
VNALAGELRWICKHDSFSVEGCTTCAAADSLEAADALRDEEMAECGLLSELASELAEVNERRSETIAVCEQLQAELESLQESYGQQLADNVALRAEVEALRESRDDLRAEVVGLRREASMAIGIRADAERWRYFVTHCEWIRHWPTDGEREDAYSYMLVRLPYGADQSCVATRNAAIDAARAAKCQG